MAAHQPTVIGRSEGVVPELGELAVSGNQPALRLRRGDPAQRLGGRAGQVVRRCGPAELMAVWGLNGRLGDVLFEDPRQQRHRLTVAKVPEGSNRRQPGDQAVVAARLQVPAQGHRGRVRSHVSQGLDRRM